MTYVLENISMTLILKILLYKIICIIDNLSIDIYNGLKCGYPLCCVLYYSYMNIRNNLWYWHDYPVGHFTRYILGRNKNCGYVLCSTCYKKNNIVIGQLSKTISCTYRKIPKQWRVCHAFEYRSNKYLGLQHLINLGEKFKLYDN